MSALGYKMVLEIEGVVIGYGTSVHDMFEIRQFDEKSALSGHVHLAFNASCHVAPSSLHNLYIQMHYS